MNSNNLAERSAVTAGVWQKLAKTWQHATGKLTKSMNELEEAEGTNKKISKQQGLQSSNSKQQG